jgi:DNA-binding transcriptional ArsR family regulator
VLDVQVLDDARAASLVRGALLVALREPISSTSLATSVGLTRQRVRYHLKVLEEGGLVVQVGERQWGGITERLLIATARSYVVSVEALGDLAGGPARVRDRPSANYLIALAAQAIRDVNALMRRAEVEHRPLATLSLETTIRFATPADRARFADEISATIREIAARYHQSSSRRGRDHRLVLLVHPTTEEAVGS